MLDRLFRWVYRVKKDWNNRSFAHETGVVVANHMKEVDGGTYTETHHVQVYGGPSGTVTTERATTISRQEFWLKTPQGEKHIWVQGKYNPVSNGNTVTLIWYGQTFMAYINHYTRQDLIIEPNLNEVAGKPSFGRHALFCFVFVPIGLLPVVGLGHLIRLSGPLQQPLYTLLGFIFGIVIVTTAFWFLLGYPVVYFFLFRPRRESLRTKIEQKIHSVTGYG